MPDTYDNQTVLVIDDDENNLDIIELDLEDENYTIIKALDGIEGLEKLAEYKDKVKVILLDRMMPRMDGMEFIQHIKKDPTLAKIPVIMQTAAAERDQVREGIEAGVYYYLTKPYEKPVMLSMIQAATTDYAELSQMRKELREHKPKLSIVKEGYYEVKTLSDVRYLSTFLANHYPNPDQVVLGISELLVNAVEHGNLGITYQDKTELLRDKIWTEEIEKRLSHPDNVNKRVLVHFIKEHDAVHLSIKDEGPGFDWEEYIEINIQRATDNHGRGIALSKMTSFDEMTYIGAGNEVRCIVYMDKATAKKE